MSDAHPLLFAAGQAIKAADTAIKELLKVLRKDPPSFLTTVALNLWSPYLPFGRHTQLDYPRNKEGGSIAKKFGKEHLERVFSRYLKLMGRNLSPNHLLVEIEGVEELLIDTTKRKLKGPNLIGEGEIGLFLPILKTTSDPVVNDLLPKRRYYEWVKWLNAEDYESRYENLLREELEQCRTDARKQLRYAPKAFVEHLAEWVTKDWVPETVGLSDFDDRWLSRLQLTALASHFWGPIWVTRTLTLDNEAEKKLGLLLTCTVTGRGRDSRGNLDHPSRIQVKRFAEKCSRLLETLMKESFQQYLNSHNLDIEHTKVLTDVLHIGNIFSGGLGGSLIGTDHENKPLKLRGLLTPGLDALPSISPAQIKVLHEINPEEVDLDNVEDHWELWKAFFKSNDLFLSNDGVALHFELTLSKDYQKLFPVPRHVVQLSGPLQKFIANIGKPPTGLLQMGFEADSTIAFHVRPSNECNARPEERIQPKGLDFKWDSSETYGNNWIVLAEALSRMLLLIKNQTSELKFFEDASKSLSILSENQIRILSDGITEVCRAERGCLVFIGPLYGDPSNHRYCFYDSSHRKKVDIARLGIYLPIVSQIPDSFSKEFRDRFSDLAGMDGETIVSSGNGRQTTGKGVLRTKPPEGYEARTAGSLLGRQFVQLPEGTPPLVDTHMPKIFEDYDKSWNAAKSSLESFHLEGLKSDGLKYKSVFVSEENEENLKKSDLLSLGTRHRKAAMTTKCLPSVLAITSSASGYIMVWLHGVPLVYLKPEKAHLLPYLQKPELRNLESEGQ